MNLINIITKIIKNSEHFLSQFHLLLSEPSQCIRNDLYEIKIWGWPGFELTNLSTDKLSSSNLLSYLLDNSEGVFFIELINRETEDIYFWVDRFSNKKIFIWAHNDEIYITDYILKFRQHASFSPQVNKTALALYLMYGYIPNEKSIYENVMALKPYHYYHYADGKLSTTKYFDIKWTDEITDFNYVVNETNKLIEESFLKLTKHHKNFLIPLSGGRDSRYLLALALKHYPSESITTFTMGTEGTFDYEIAKRLSEKLKLKNILLKFSKRDHFERFVETSTYYKNSYINHSIQTPGDFYSQVLKNNQDSLILSGYIGDVVLDWNHGKNFIQKDNLYFPKPNHFSLEQVIQILTANEQSELLDELKSLTNSLMTENNKMEQENWFYFIRATYFTNICMFSDPSQFHYALPFVENNLFNFLMKVDRKIKSNKNFYEYILKQDNSVFQYFKFPLKTLRGKGYSNSRVSNSLNKLFYRILSFKNGGHAMLNYLDFNSLYKQRRFLKMIKELEEYEFLIPLLKSHLSQPKAINTSLLISLKLNMDFFFKA